MHYLVTGHTGFKGAWLTLMLRERGHQVSGLALDPEPGSLFELAGISADLEVDARGDIRNPEAVASVVDQVQPDVVIHMAAQPLVRDSYQRPRWTMETNVMGTLNVLEAVSACDRVQAQVIITTDKVYENRNQVSGYVEADPLGAADPYSTSKAMADLLTQSWVCSFNGPPTAIARAGNVIGGGDVSADRLVPDLVTAFQQGSVVQLRYPESVRPWQHVLDCLNGYLVLTDALLSGGGAGEWNFGPGADSFRTVSELSEHMGGLWGVDRSWAAARGDHPHEAGLLALDSSRAQQELGWANKLNFVEAVRATSDWYWRVKEGEDARDVTLEQIRWFGQL